MVMIQIEPSSLIIFLLVFSPNHGPFSFCLKFGEENHTKETEVSGCQSEGRFKIRDLFLEVLAEPHL